jgi:uncharacterized protein YkwD
MSLWKLFVQYFIPSKGNKYRPIFLRIEMAGAMVVVIFALFTLSVVMQRMLLTNSSSQVAAVIASALVDLANNDRAQNNISSLTVSPQLQAAAQAKANDMAANGYFAHVSPIGRDPWHWFTQAGYNFSYGGENLAVYFSDSNTVNTAWMNSPEHRANILNEHFTEIGVATAQGMYQGHETTFVVQEFGTPASVATGTVQPTSVSLKDSKSLSVAGGASPQVKGASIAKPNVKIIVQDTNFIAVENENASTSIGAHVSPLKAPASTQNPVSVFMLRFVTSPSSDLVVAYSSIGVIILLALGFEVVTELRRPRAHRILLGLSLISLMGALLFVGQTIVFGQLLIA